MTMFKIGLLLGVVALVACDDKATYAPRAGDYGTHLVSSYELAHDKVAAMNTLAIKPVMQAEDAAKAYMAFQPIAEHNPYRAVVVARGQAKTDGKVDLRFIYGVSAGEHFKAKVLREEDDSQYKAGERVLLVLAGEPFSVAKGADGEYYVQMILTERNNLDITSLEMQLWRGQGKRLGVFQLLGLGAVIFMIIVMAYRIATRH